ncbi:MAG: TatD family hydrolase [Gammaproteobacteria bacterium]|nr:TatD family hydrolase [Gammaproteobacteria bacterium]MCP5424292.1 TatD family hydrolase [Gammaproteobacteria bacterium]MCP5459045.1 TatD family hydrolase [Gammaproteobacteria bacterium]
MLVDSHCHLDRLDLKPFQSQLRNALAAAEAHGVRHFLCVGITLEDWPAMLRQVQEFAQVSTSIGVHPSAKNARPPDFDKLRRLAEHPKVVAIGETGLDYFHDQEKDRQHGWLRTQIAVAKAVAKPLIIHTRNAREDTLRLLKEERAEEIGGVIHCFSEDWDAAVRFMDLNFAISLSGIVTFKNAKTLHEVARRLPADRLLVETDSPYLAPEPHRGKSNQPAWVRHVAAAVARLRDVPLDRIAETTTANYFRLFGRS